MWHWEGKRQGVQSSVAAPAASSKGPSPSLPLYNLLYSHCPNALFLPEFILPRAAAASRRDAASRQVSQWVAKLREALDAAELKDGEVEELRQQRSRVGVGGWVE